MLPIRQDVHTLRPFLVVLVFAKFQISQYNNITKKHNDTLGDQQG